MQPSGYSAPAPGAVPTHPTVTDNSGAARFGIAIEAPPGPGGFAPKIELAYSSRAGDGPYGVGWALGIPEIRCSGRFGVPDFSNCEQYELGNSLLVEDTATANEYHTLVESFQRIRYSGAPTGDYWTVEQPNGTQLIFGEHRNHRISQGGSTARWLLQRSEDAFGNTIFFEYDTATDVGAAYPASVYYGAGSTRTSGPREIHFVYEARPDARHVFSGGIERKMTQRLIEIQVIGHGEVFRRYAFGYNLTGVVYTTDRSRLSWVQEFGTDCTDLANDPVGSCSGLPRREFRYRDPSRPGFPSGSSPSGANDDYRIPFGSYQSTTHTLWKSTYPQLIGDINGDGLPDRVQLYFENMLEPVTQSLVFINTGSGFSLTDPSAVAYKASFDSLTYDQPRLNYEQIPAPITGVPWWKEPWNAYSMYAMCSVTPTTRVATLSQELLHRGVGAATSSLKVLQDDNGNPSQGFFEPRPSVKMADLDADGLADLVISVRLSGVARHFDCNGTPLAQPESFPASTTTVVFRNTGSGWENDAAAQELADGLPPFEEVIVKSTYQTELDEPPMYFNNGHLEEPMSTCANSFFWGFEQVYDPWPDLATAVCHTTINLVPRFVDFNGDGFLDLAVLQRDDPDLLWTGDGWFYYQGLNKGRTRVWIQQPNGSQRWVRAPQYDLPSDIWPTEDEFSLGFAHMRIWGEQEVWGGYVEPCRSWDPDFMLCGGFTRIHDPGVRFADLNGDGLTDVVWKGGEHLAGGVLLNTGGGSNPFSAWCASDSGDVQFVGSGCPEAAAYLPPGNFVVSEDLHGRPTTTTLPAGMLGDLNGDGSLDFVRVQWPYYVTESWIQSPAGATAASVWQRDTDFDFPIVWGRPVTHPASGETVPAGPVFEGFLPIWQVFDINGDGSADLVGDQDAFLSRSRHSDLISSVDNGRDGLVEVEYDSMIWQRDASLEADAEFDAQERPDGGNVTLWQPWPVVSEITVTGPDFADAVTTYRYARPRFSSDHRSNVGFRLFEQTRPDTSTVEAYFYQDHGRAGRTSSRLVNDAVGVIHHYAASWEHVPGSIAIPGSPIPGSISDVFLSRLAWNESVNEYAGGSGALRSRIFSYDDAHGYNFVSEIRTERPTGILVDTREPDSDLGSYVIGRNARRTLTDDVTDTILRDTIFTYLDLDGDPTGPKIGSRRELIRERGSAGSDWVDVVKLRYDGYGNLNEEMTPSPALIPGGDRSTLYCYDGDGGWCPSPVGQSSHSVRVASQDPLGNVIQMTPDARSGTIVAIASDYTDEPSTRTALDPFGRPRFEYVTPNGGTEILVAENRYHEVDPPRVERFDYVDEAATEAKAIYSAEVLGAFGGVWKAIEETPSGYVGVVTYSDAATRRVRTTLPLDCDQSPTCAGLWGDIQPATREVESDALGRPIRIDTPDGFSIMAYSSIDDPWGTDSLDGVLEKNGKGDLRQRAFDGNRPVRVDECHVGVGAGLDTLVGIACRTADTTQYTYEATGEIQTIYDPRAVASSNFTDPNHRLRYAYDTLGRVVRIEDPDLDGIGYSLTTYNDAGLVKSTTNARNQMRVFGYDVLGRLSVVTTPSGEDDYTVTYRPTERQRKKDTSDTYERVRTYDDWGRLEQTELSVVEASGPIYGFDWSGTYLTNFEYDVAGRPVEVVHPESTTVRYEYAGAYLKRVCDLGTAADCLDSGAVAYVSDVTYDELGRRAITQTDAGTRTFTYDGSLARLLQDRFDASSDPYWLQRNFDSHDELGNLMAMSGSSQPGDIDLNESFQYDTRNRLDSWTKEGQTHDYDYDDLGNLTLHAGFPQVFDDASRPHAIKNRGNGDADYAYDADGNVTSIAPAVGSTRYFKFDSANRLVCVATVENGCNVSRIHYDVDGRRVFDDKGSNLEYVAYVDDSVIVDSSIGGGTATRIEIRAFGERIAYKRSFEARRTAGLVPFVVPPTVVPLLGLLGLVGLLAWAARRGALLLVLERPGYVGVSSVLVVALMLGPVPLARAGGGGSPTNYWELADRLGTGMVMLDETGARLMHRTYTPFGVEHASAGTVNWLPSHYAGHLEDEDSGLVYMQARWMDPASGTFLSVDPLVGNAGDPQSYNAYAYARNNPVSNVDPTGMAQWECYGNCGGTMYFTNAAGSFNVVPFSASQTSMVVDFAGRFDSVGGNVSVNGFSVSFSDSTFAGLQSDKDRPQGGDADSRAPGAIHLTGHDIAFGEGHLAAEFRPDADTTAETISGEPSTLTGINERLVGEVDRASDRPVLNRTVGSIVPPAGVTPAGYWATLRGAVGAFNSGPALDYDLGAGYLPGRLGDGYNSNGFLVGIVRATGGQVRGSLSGFVGAGRPVPSSAFGR